MCGIAGLLIRDEALEEKLGALITPMMAALEERGPDSAGVAIYGTAQHGHLRFSLRRVVPIDWQDLEGAISLALGAEASFAKPVSGGDLAVMDIAIEDPGSVLAALGEMRSSVVTLGWGRSMEVVKGTGRAGRVCTEHGVDVRGGYMALGHTRMATESAVTVDHSHPFTPQADLAVVHNGSFSNHASVRRRLEAEGVSFVTDNDSEVAARYLGRHLETGESLDEAVRWLTKEMDGFFTIAVATEGELSVVRDAFSCKPAVIAETAAYIAVASEYRALAPLPGIEHATVFEPQPEEVYTWSR